MAKRRALHWVFKVENRQQTMNFYRDVLGMTILRHEEFKKGCDAACNGPYDGQWSKTMVGYGAEDNHFVIELTYNYGIKSYDKGNDFHSITIHSSAAVARAKERANQLDNFIEREAGVSVSAPGGYEFNLIDEDVADGNDPCQCIALNVTNMETSLAYWRDLLGLTVREQTATSTILSYGERQCNLDLREVGEGNLDRGTAYGRIAFACARAELPGIESAVKDAGHNILTPLISLDTPGKATVEVVILEDPSGHEICFVGDEAFHELSLVDPKASELLDQGIQEDSSDEYYRKKAERAAKLEAKLAAQAKAKEEKEQADSAEQSSRRDAVLPPNEQSSRRDAVLPAKWAAFV